MTSPSPVDQQGNDQTVVAEPDFATEVHKFWEQNRQKVLIGCGAILLGVAGFFGWQELTRSQDEGTRAAYAGAGVSPEKLTAFAADHPNHALAAIALLQVADAKYASGDFSAALSGYQKVAEKLTNATLKGRARLGAAVSKLGTGDQAGAEGDLKSLGADTTADKQIRAEATYHLATLLNTPGRAAEVRQLLDEVTKLDDAGGIWAQRAGQLQQSLLAEGLTAKP